MTVSTTHTEQNVKFPTTHYRHGEVNRETSDSQIIRHDLDPFPDLENFLIDEEVTKTLAITLMVTTFIWLANTFFW